MTFSKTLRWENSSLEAGRVRAWGKSHYDPVQGQGRTCFFITKRPQFLWRGVQRNASIHTVTLHSVSKYLRSRKLSTSITLMSRTQYPEVLPHAATGFFLFISHPNPPKQLGQLKTWSSALLFHKNLIFHNCPQAFCILHFYCFKLELREVPQTVSNKTMDPSCPRCRFRFTGCYMHTKAAGCQGKWCISNYSQIHLHVLFLQSLGPIFHGLAN